MLELIISIRINSFFIKYLAIWSFIDVCYELRSYERGVAQLGSAGALGVADYTNQKYCNKWIKVKYYNLFSES